METRQPRVRFQVPSELESYRYLDFLHSLESDDFFYIFAGAEWYFCRSLTPTNGSTQAFPTAHPAELNGSNGVFEPLKLLYAKLLLELRYPLFQRHFRRPAEEFTGE